jgi:hypothetical protein
MNQRTQLIYNINGGIIKLLLLPLLLVLLPSISQGGDRSEKFKRRAMEDVEAGIIGDWKLRDAHYHPVKSRIKLVNYRYVAKEYRLEHFSFRADHTFTWVSTKDSATYTGTWEITPFDRLLKHRKWGYYGDAIELEEALRWHTDLTLTYTSGTESQTKVFDDIAVERRLGKPVKISYISSVPNKGRDYLTFYFVPDRNKGDD